MVHIATFLRKLSLKGNLVTFLAHVPDNFNPALWDGGHSPLSSVNWSVSMKMLWNQLVKWALNEL